MSIDYMKEGKVAIITLNRPESLNAITPEMLRQLSEVLIDFRDDEQLMVGIITGAGEKAFSIGADIGIMLPEMKKARAQKSPEPPTIMCGLVTWKPLIAAINGACLGGGLELALACDLRIASENATFGMPEVTLGLIPGWGGTQRLPRAIPLAKATEMLLTGRPINAQEAYRIGLVNRLVPLPQLMSTARQLAELLCKPAPMAVRAAKQAILQGIELTLEEGLDLERRLNDALLSTEDFEEGCRAALEHRRPVFKGK